MGLKTPYAVVSPDWPQILSSAVNNDRLWRKTNSAACHLSLGLKLPAGSSCGAPALLFLFVVVMVGVCPCQSRHLVHIPPSPCLNWPLPTAPCAFPRFWPLMPGSALLPPGEGVGGEGGILLYSAEINYIVSQQAEGLPLSGCKWEFDDVNNGNSSFFFSWFC